MLDTKELTEKIRLLLCQHEGANPESFAYDSISVEIMDLIKEAGLIKLKGE